MEKEVEEKIKEYFNSIKELNINIQSEFARDMITKDIINIVKLHVSEWKQTNVY